jgi:hypothetical protein
MANIHAAYLKEKEILALAEPIAREHFNEFGYSHIDISEQEDFDGANVIQIVAHLDQKIAANVIVDALDALNNAVWKQGDDRFVYLRITRPGEDRSDDDEE